MTTVAQIRQDILDAQKAAKPDWVWVEGEPLVDIIDSVATFQQRREFIETLTKNLLNSETTVNTFSQLMNDNSYRQQTAAIIGLSLNSRNFNYAGVPSDVTNDLDAFIWYYMDRYAEKNGFRRNTGGAASTRIYFQYPVAVTSGVANIIMTAGDKIYKASVNLNGQIVAGMPTRREISGIIYSIGYGQKYNVVANALVLNQVWGTITTTTDLMNLTTDAMTGGSDYQSNESFLIEIQTNIAAGTGVGARKSVAQIISGIDTIDKYLIVGTRTGLRFKGSLDIYIKGSQKSIWQHEVLVGSDRRVLVPYQPSTVMQVWQKGSPNILLSATGATPDYIVEDTTGDFLYSTRQQSYLFFPLNASNVMTPLVDIAILEMEVDSDCLAANTAMNDYYSANREYARDWLIRQAQPQSITIDLQVKTKVNIDQTTLNSLVLTNIQNFIADFVIEDGTGNAKLDASDIINSIYSIVNSNGNIVIDSVEDLIITKTDDTGNAITPQVLQTTAESPLATNVHDLGSLYLTTGYYWFIFNVTVTNV